MAMEFHHAAEFAAPADRIWAYLIEPEKQTQWIKGWLRLEPQGEGPVGIGSQAKMVIREGGREAIYRSEIVAFEKGKHLRVRMTGGCMKGDTGMLAEYRLSEREGSTRVEFSERCENAGFVMRLFGPLFKVFGRMQVKGWFRRLRVLVENA